MSNSGVNPLWPHGRFAKHRKHIGAVAGVAIISCLLPIILLAQKVTEEQTDPNLLVRAVVNNELRINQQDRSHWMYRDQRQEARKSTVKEVIETKNCEVDLLVSSNGQLLTPEQRQKENERLEKLVTDPEAQRKKMKEGQEDDRKAAEMFKMLPDAFLYQYKQSGQSLILLSFTPNPRFHPPTREAQVFHEMEGTMLVDAREKRLVELDGELAQNVQFLGGLIGHLDKGGRFSVKRAEVIPGHWETTLIKVQMTGKVIIFKSISLQQMESMTDFDRVPEDLSPLQAADLLKQQDLQHSAAKQFLPGSNWHQSYATNNLKESQMSAFRAVRNALGTASLIFAGYVLLTSLKDSWRYVKISRM